MTIDPTPYTPDDEEIFSAYADAEFGTPSVEVLVGWDRWLAARDARVRAEALRDAADAWGDGTQEFLHYWLYGRAASIEQETQT